MAIEPILRDAVVFASLLSLLSLGLTLTYVVTKVPNFSHGSIATIGIYVTLTATQVLRSGAYEYLPLAFLLGGIANLLLYFVAIRPLNRRGAGLVSLMVATIAYDLVLVAILNIYADYLTTAFRIESRGFILRQFDLQFVGQPGVFVTAPLVGVVLSVALYAVLTKTRFGIAMRAAIEDQALAGILGINVRQVYVVSWFIAGGLGGLAGAMLGLWFLSDPGYGDAVLISIFAAAMAVSFGAVGPALGEGRAVASAMDAIARQPDSAGTVSRTLFVGLAMIETMAIYALVIALLVLFANPFVK